jgi:hypothetical protein
VQLPRAVAALLQLQVAAVEPVKFSV